MSEIPGFFKDPVSGKYFRDTGECSGNTSLKRLKLNVEELREEPKIVLKYSNSLQFLKNRELGATAGVQAKTDFFQIKTSFKEKTLSSTLSIPFNDDSCESCEVNFIKGDDISFFGMWCVSNGCKEKYIMGEIKHDMNNEGYFPQRYRPGENIVDMCRTPTEFTLTGFITISNDPPHHPSGYNYILKVHVRIPKKYWPPTWYSCCYMKGPDSTVLGGDGSISIINQRVFLTDYCVKFHGKVYTLSYDEPSGVLMSGIHTGVIQIHDPRSQSVAHTLKISDKAINDSLLLNGQEVIVTDVEGKLVKVDLRVGKISSMFFGHQHSVTKRPFSATNDMLCATGVDNVVRIWEISGGHPIHVHKSTSGHEVRGWLNSDSNKTYLNYFEKDTRTVFKL